MIEFVWFVVCCVLMFWWGWIVKGSVMKAEQKEEAHDDA